MDGKQLKNSILQWAIQGKLVPQNPKDEPASKLLERIAASRNGATACHPERNAVKSKDLKKKKSAPTSRIYRENGIWYEQVGTATPKDISDEIPFEIPENWAWARWGNLSDSIQYGYNAPALESGRIKMVRISDIHDNKIEWTKVPYCQITENEIPTYLLQKNDILFARTGGTVGKSYLVGDVATEAVYAGYLIRTRYNFNLLSPQYLKFFMESSLYWEQLREGTIATAQPNCNGKTLGKMLLPLPPLAEQKRIVAKLEQVLPLAEEYGAAQEQLDKLNRELPEALKKSILQEAVQGKLVPQNPKDEPASVLLAKIRKEKEALVKQGKLKKKDLESTPIDDEEIPFEIPDSWTWCRLGDIVSKLVDGDHNPPSGIAGKTDYMMLSSRNINFDKLVDLDNARYLEADVFAKENERTDATIGDILFTSVGTIGRSCVLKENVNICFQRSVTVMTTYVYNEYLKRYFDSPFYQNYANEHAVGTAQRGFYLKEMEQSLIALPPLAEQKRIVTKLEQLFKVL